MSISSGQFSTFDERPGLALTRGPYRETENERLLNGFLDELIQDSTRLRQPKEQEWLRNIRSFSGSPMGDPRAPGLSMTRLNNIWRIVNLYVALLTDAKPRPEISARRAKTQEMHEAAKDMKDTVEAIWFMQDFDRKIARICYDLEFFAKGFMKTIWDPGLAWGEGDVSILRVDPRYVYTDRAEDIRRGQYLCYRAPVPLWELRALFPQRGHLVEPDFISETQDATQPLPPGVPIRPPSYEAGWRGIPRAWTEEWLIRDPEIDAGTLKYPNGRLITRAGARKTLLVDSGNPVKDEYPGPWAEFNATFDPDNPWNTSDITLMRPLQQTLDNLTRYMEDNAAFLTAGIWLAEQRSLDLSQLEAQDMLLPRPGRVVWYKPGSNVKRDMGTGLPAHLVEVVKMIYQAMESVSGLMDASAAKIPRGITAGAAIEQLQSSTQAAIRLRSRELEAGQAQVGQHTINRVLQHYTRERLLDLLGDDGQVRTIHFDPMRFLFAGQSEEERYRMYQFMITPGSSLALSRERQYAYHAALFSMGAIDQEAFLDAIDYPNRGAIMTRMTAAKAGVPMAQARVGPTPRGRGTAVTRKLLGSLQGSAGGGNSGGGTPY